MAALNPFKKANSEAALVKKRVVAAIAVVSSDDDDLQELVPLAGGSKGNPCHLSGSKPVDVEDSLELPLDEHGGGPAGRSLELAVGRDARVSVCSAGMAAVNGTYVAQSNGDGTYGFRQEGSGQFAIAWWEEQPGEWQAGWYLFVAATDEGVYCTTQGDEAHLPLVTWDVYAGPESKPGLAPAPRTEEVKASSSPSKGSSSGAVQGDPCCKVLDVRASVAVLIRGAGTQAVNGTYVADACDDGGFQFVQEGGGQYAIAWWEAQPGQWLSGWYIYAAEAEEGIYSSTCGDEAHFPLGTPWEVYSGSDSSPGLMPPPRSDERANAASADLFVYARANLPVGVFGAGTQAVNGRYTAGFGDDGAIRFVQQGNGRHAIAWWDAEPGQWRAGWYIFAVDGEQGVYCLSQGDEARFPLGGWEIYTGPDSQPGRAPPPRTARVGEAPWLASRTSEEDGQAELEGGWRGFRAGASVELAGLSGAKELNGQRGRLLRFDPEALRWQVCMEGNLGTKALRPANLVLLPEEDAEEWWEEERAVESEVEELQLDSCPDSPQSCASAEGPAKRPKVL